MYIEETYINRTKNYRIGESGIYESFTNDLITLFKSLKKEYGRCTGKVRVDPDGQAIGWIFERLLQYEDSDNRYLQETWVTLHEKLPEKHTVYNYHYLRK